ncbi:histone H3.v1 [Cucumis melo var. makuwa]|uniref:Histone H3.v1 n=2 Tax=Cucumis melo TaxID=3656 RepID=A0A5A7UYV1_CUCMM|nr:histone H3.v1 [Cucumis melo var. makuwa]TYK10468.1 histone H3.v1 [Cucumis melo var. makuwa]
MAESEQITATWGTWEELLLACAVKRHGFKDWNSVSMEVQARSSLPHLLTTARNCELKFQDLKRRFTSFQNDAVLNHNASGIADKLDTALPWVDELRKLRVAELRREVQRYDVSINSLQLKVKKLEEEREQGVNDREASTGKPDLKTESRERRSENDKKHFGEPDHRSGPNGTVTKPPPVPGEDSDREDFSVNQSNSTGSKSGNPKSTAEIAKSETKPDFTGSYRPEQNRRTVEPAGPQSDDGSTDTVVKNPTCDISETKKKETQRVDDSSELADSEAQSHGGGTTTRESSEVQSSASLTGRMKRKRLLRNEISGGSSGNEPRRSAGIKSRRFDEVLQLIRAHKHGSLFESRLQSQETEEYKGMVRQHLDLEIVQTKINSGSYSSSNLAFYRDLLLLFNNVVTFFPKSSKEAVAACELRLLVSNEMKKSLRVAQTDPLPEVVDSPPTIPSQSKGPDLEGSQALLAKQKSSVPIVVCRKRSKISNPSTTGTGEKGDRSNDDEKPAADLKSSIKIVSNLVEEDTTKDSKVKEKPTTGARSMRRSNDSATNSSGPSSSKKQNITSRWKPSSANETEIPTPDKKKSETVALEKKRSAADFLKRIKQNSPAETTKRNGRGGSSGGVGNATPEQKKGNSKNDKAKERVSSTMKQSNDKKRPKEDASPSKRSVGRPPKKAAEAEPPTPIKRAREGGGKEPLKRPRKKSKR